MDEKFIDYLVRLAKDDDRAALAALRRGLGQPPGTATEMHRHVAMFLPDGVAFGPRQQSLYIVASLFGMHPKTAASGNMGGVMRQIAASHGSESIEGRFVALLKCHRDDLADHLRHAVSLARGCDVSICWQQLLDDIRNWDHDTGYVQRKWAQSFWGRQPEEVKELQTPEPTATA